MSLIELDNGEMRMITSCDDNRLLAYNVKTRQALAEGQVNEKPKKKKKEKAGYKGGASSMSSEPANCQSRSIAYSKKHKHLAVADNTGHVTIREIDWAEVDARKEGSLDKVMKKPGTMFTDKKMKPAAEWIECMHYSPCEKYLAVGSHNNMIYILDVDKGYKEKYKLTGHSSFITSLDWSQDSSYIRSVCGAYELLFFNVANKGKRDPSGASNTVATVWADQTCKLGWCVQGIFPSGCDGSHINSVAMTSD
jgi:WD40 repeat protein